MTSKKEQEKLQAERHQLIIQELLRDEDNKYCVDCDAKGPRWASWNIGVFLCIRCAGIHRNLGVHISKVKSVNLDTWTLAQLAMMREMGNSRARAIYEARLPDNFRRPQSDSALETFIRSKYEHKRYIALEYVPIKPDVDALMKEIQRLEHSTKKRHSSNVVNLPQAQSPPLSKKHPSAKPVVKAVEPAAKEQPVDLLGLGTTDPVSTPNSGESFTPFTSALSFSAPGDPGAKQVDTQPSTVPNSTGAVEKHASEAAGGGAALDLFGLNFGEPSSSTASTDTFGGPTLNLQHSSPPATTAAKCSKESILALYQQCPTTTGLFQAPPPATTCPTTYNQFMTSAPSTNWPFTGGATLSNPTANNNRSIPTFGEPQHAQQAPTAVAFQQQQYSANFGPPSTGVTPFALHAESQSQGPISFQPPATNAVSGNGMWPDESKNWPTQQQQLQPPTNLFGPSGSALSNAGDRNQNLGWNMTQNAPSQPANSAATAFGTPNFFAPSTVNTTAAAHQAYLAQVQSQLASLQLGAAINHQQ